MSNVIKVTVKNVYGVNKIYPACSNSKAFADIAGTKTLTEEVIAHIKSIGFDIEVIAPTITL